MIITTAEQQAIIDKLRPENLRDDIYELCMNVILDEPERFYSCSNGWNYEALDELLHDSAEAVLNGIVEEACFIHFHVIIDIHIRDLIDDDYREEYIKGLELNSLVLVDEAGIFLC